MPEMQDLLDNIIQFLQNQEEVYGTFKVPEVEQISRTVTEAKLAENRDSTKTVSDQIPNENQTNDLNKQNEKDIYEQVKACKTLDELYALCEKADVLKTDLPNTNLVFGVGNPSADLMLIGEAPGKNEDEQGEPFVGRAGKLLNKILEAINMRREDVYIANIIKHRPPKNRDPLPEERERSLPFLEKQIELIDPKIILCLGRISAQTLLSTNQPMKALRGTFHPYMDKYELTLTYHPAALLRNPNWKRSTWEDVQMVRKRYDELGCKP